MVNLLCSLELSCHVQAERDKSYGPISTKVFRTEYLLDTYYLASTLVLNQVLFGTI